MSYDQAYATALKSIDEQRQEIERLKKDLAIEKERAPFYAELSNEYERALGPHPTIPNGCWIQRSLELRQQRDVLATVLRKHVKWHEENDDHGGWPASELNEETMRALAGVPEPA